MNLLKNVFVINLDSRTDRWEHALCEFDKLGCTVERLSAIPHYDGAIGCTMSHIKCLELALERGYEYVTICEDDITFTKPNTFLDSLRKFENSPPKQWDILLLGGVVYSDDGHSYDIIEKFYARVYYCQTTTGYIVSRHYMPTLLDNFRSGLKQYFETGNRGSSAIDCYWKQLQCRDLWYFLTPPTVIQYGNWSNIENSHTDYGIGMLRLQNVDVKIEDE
jgi:GR25 family glycosyltransferase involved in LPS biosynthesis